MKKILVTGGAGFIGAHLVNKLSVNKKYKILVVDILKKRGGIPYINPKSKFIKGNITNKKILKKIEKWKPDIIYHLAAQSGGEGSYENPKEDLITNGYGTYLIANLAKKINCKKLIYTSTVAVYGSNKKNVINEKSNIAPDSLYGISKYSGELFINHTLRNTKVKTFIFRIFNTYGPGENLNNLKKGMVGIYCSFIWRNKPILVKGSLNRFRNFVYVDDCAEILAKTIENRKLNNHEVFNLTSEKKVYVRDLVRNILRINKINDFRVIIKKGTPGDSFGYHSNNKYLSKKFSNLYFTNINKGLIKYFQWLKDVPNKKHLNNYHPFKLLSK